MRGSQEVDSDKRKRAAMYLRISQDHTGEGLGVDRQRQACMEHIRYKGWDLVGEYVDNSVSATSKKPRPEYERLVADVKAGKLDWVVVWRIDRLTRNPVEIYTWFEYLKEYGTVLTTTDGSMDLNSTAGQVVAGTMAVFAHAEMQQKGERQKAAHRQRAESGLPWGFGRRPFGFEDDLVTHHPVEAPMLQEVYRKYLAGATQTELARWLDERVTTTAGKHWRQSTVRNMLLNPRNAGIRVHNKVEIGPGVWEPIVDEQIFRAAKLLLSSGKSTGGGARKHLLIGVAVCGVCEAPARTAITNRGVRLYKCETGKHVGRHAENMDAWVTQVAIARLSRSDVAELTKPDDAPVEDDLPAKAAALRAKRKDLMSLWATTSMTPEVLAHGQKVIQDELREIETKLAEKEATRAMAPLLAATNVAERWERMGIAERRSVIGALMTVAILPAGRGNRFDPTAIEIRWKT